MNAVIVEIVVPKTILNLCCDYRRQPDKNARTYKLTQTDPEGFDNLIRTIKSASSSQFHFRLMDERKANRAFMDALAEYNMYHPNAQIDPADLVKQVSRSNYYHTFIGTSGDDKGKEFHVFKNVVNDNFKTFPKTVYYVKLITPDELGNIDVVSLHTTANNFQKKDPGIWYFE